MQTFDQLDLNEGILKSITELGFVNPTPIQEKCIPHILETEKDLIGLAQTGTGKTAAFGLPVLNQLDFSNKKPQCLILCPTRELCMQITSDLQKYAKYVANCRITAVYGGASIVPQMNDLRRGTQIIVGTPGRTLDLVKRKALDISNINWLILDEADEMLNMGFKEELNNILEHAPKERQTLLFSATMPKGIASIAKKYMESPMEISVGKKNAGADNVNHIYYLANARDHYAVLKRIADMNPSIYAMVFCRTRAATRELSDKLMKDGYNADALHGDLSQAQRDFVMNRFRTKHLQILVCTDVAARGLDVNDLSHVINYGLPNDSEAYIHRSGRTGRAGKSGTAVSIIHTREKRKLRDIEHVVTKKFEQVQIPGGKEICEKQLFNMLDRMQNVEIDEKGMADFLPAVYAKLENLDREELIKRFVSTEFNRFLAYYEKAGDINVQSKDSRDGREGRERRDGRDRRDGRRDGGRGSRERREDFKGGERSEKRSRRDNQDFTRFYINLGTHQQLNASRLLSFINQNTHGLSIDVGQIEILKKFSFFEADTKHEKDVLDKLKSAEYEGEKITVQVSEPDPKGTDAYKERKEKKFTRSGKGPSKYGKPSSSSRGGGSSYNRANKGDRRSKRGVGRKSS